MGMMSGQDQIAEKLAQEEAIAKTLTTEEKEAIQQRRSEKQKQLEDQKRKDSDRQSGGELARKLEERRRRSDAAELPTDDVGESGASAVDKQQKIDEQGVQNQATSSQVAPPSGSIAPQNTLASDTVANTVLPESTSTPKADSVPSQGDAANEDAVDDPKPNSSDKTDDKPRPKCCCCVQ